MMMTTRAQDVNGKESSKRYWARRFFTFGFWAAIIIFVIWVISFIFDKELTIPDQLIEIWKWLMGFGSAILIGTAFERKTK